MAAVMLLIGFGAGYLLRPLINAEPPQVITATPGPTQTRSAEASPTSQAISEVTAESLVRHWLGDPAARVTMIEFSDFQWGYCGRYATGAGRQVIQEYVNKGIVRFGYVGMAFLNEASTLSAVASECAAEQGEAYFWSFHDRLFDNLTSASRQAVNNDTLGQFALELGMDGKDFSQCLGSGKYTTLVEQTTSAAGSLGVSSTPTFLINGQKITGAKSFEVFKAAIEIAAGIITPAATTQTAVKPFSTLAPPSTPVADKMAAAIAAARHWRGDEKAPVTFIEFSNFLWPNCGRYAAGAGRQVEEEYIKTGIVRQGMIQMAFVEGESTQAAEAAECASEQGEDAYWHYYERLYENQLSASRVEFSYDNLKGFAAEIGLEAGAFNTCLDSGKYKDLVEAQKQAGFSLGVDSTPTFFINGTVLKGSQTFETLKAAIEAARGK